MPAYEGRGYKQTYFVREKIKQLANYLLTRIKDKDAYINSGYDRCAYEGFDNKESIKDELSWIKKNFKKAVSVCIK